MVDKISSETVVSDNCRLRVQKAIDDIVLSPRYLVRVTKALLETDEVLYPVTHVVKIEADRVVEVSSKREE